MTTRFVLRGADVVGPTRVLSDGALVVEDDRIAEVLSTVPPLGGEDVRWVRGIVAPAFIDLHSDALEREVRPRPTAVVPLDLALTQFDRALAGHGVTTMFHAVTFAEEEGARHHGESERVAEAVDAEGDLLIRHRIHGRYELTDVEAAPTLDRLIGDGRVQLLSFADHTPGERQYKDRAAYVDYYSRAYGISGDGVAAVAERKLRRKTTERELVRQAVETLAAAARRAGIAMASHDDDSAEQVASAVRLGMAISEFPVNQEALWAAQSAGLLVVMGAPNVVRGGSASRNLSALAALAQGALDVLCSDYYPASLLHAVVKLAREGHRSLSDAFALATSHPARAVGMDDDLGSLEPGKLADLIVIGSRGDLPVVTRTFREGREVWRCDYGATPRRDRGAFRLSTAPSSSRNVGGS